jgi:predicted protein tyrosine phosphatase
MPPQLNILFVCGESRRRSATAEKIFTMDRRMSVRAAGLGETVPRRVRDEDLRWADLVLVMERKYVVRLKHAFRHLDTLPPIMELGIPDKFIFMNPVLVERLREGVNEALETYRLEQEV